MRSDPTSTQIRATLDRLASEHSVSLAALSRMIRRPAGYLSRFVRLGTPERLDDDAIDLLAGYFRCDPHDLGWREPANN